MDVRKVIDFCELILQFRDVERRITLPESQQRENDVEHSYMLAMVAWYVASTYPNLGLDIGKVIKYALAHDIVETYAGDTYIFDAKQAADKLEREVVAADMLKKYYPDFNELHHYIEQYELREDAESQFVYALDKVLPVMVIFVGQGQTWQEQKITYRMLRRQKDPKVSVSPIVAELWSQMVKLLDANRMMFPQTSDSPN